MTFDGLDRTWLMHVPPGVGGRVPLVFSFHGLRTTAALQRYISEMDPAADAHGYVVVYPEGTGPSLDESWNAGNCCESAAQNDVDDVGFTLAILDRLRAPLCVDARRVYAAGLSNGGHMVYRLACEAADTFAAVASVAGVETTFPCTPSRPISLLHIHGDANPVVNYTFGIDGIHGAHRSVSDFAGFDGCGESTSVVYQNGVVTCTTRAGCAGGTDVELCTVAGGGHQWPGGHDLPSTFGDNTTDLDATEHISNFFLAHALP